MTTSPQSALAEEVAAALQSLYEGRTAYALICADNVAALGHIADDVVDGALLDPPYGLGTRSPTPEEILAFLSGAALDHRGDFMAMDWSIPTVAFWKALYRVMKPGAWIGVYGGTQADDLLSMAARLGGFVREDAIEVFGTARFAWLQAQGMPHGLNIARAIDEAAGEDGEDLGAKVYPDGRGRPGSTADLGRMNDDAWDGGAARRVVKVQNEQAQRWEGHHTQLAPKHEVVLLFRKPASPVRSTELYNATGWDYWHVVTPLRTPDARCRAEARFGCAIPATGDAQLRRRRPLHEGVLESYELRWRREHIARTTKTQRYVDCGACGRVAVPPDATGCPTCSGLFLSFCEVEEVEETITLGAWEVLAVVDGDAYQPWSTDSTAASVLVRGCGTLNIDATRVYTDWNEPDRGAAWKRSGHTAKPEAKKIAGAPPGNGIVLHEEGRFTPNIAFVHDPACEPPGTRTVKASGPANVTGSSSTAGRYVRRSNRGQPSTEALREAGRMETLRAWQCAAVCPACGPAIAMAGGDAGACPRCAAPMTWLCPVAELDAQSGLLISGRLKNGQIDHGKQTGRLGTFRGRVLKDREPSVGGASRFFPSLAPPFRYAAKVPPRERNAGLPRGQQNPGLCLKPLLLGVHLAKLLCPPGGLTLTTHAGTGSDVAAMVLAGTRCLGIERDPAMVAIANQHIPGLLRFGGSPSGEDEPSTQQSIF